MLQANGGDTEKYEKPPVKGHRDLIPGELRDVARTIAGVFFLAGPLHDKAIPLAGISWSSGSMESDESLDSGDLPSLNRKVDVEQAKAPSFVKHADVEAPPVESSADLVKDVDIPASSSGDDKKELVKPSPLYEVREITLLQRPPSATSSSSDSDLPDDEREANRAAKQKIRNEQMRLSVEQHARLQAEEDERRRGLTEQVRTDDKHRVLERRPEEERLRPEQTKHIRLREEDRLHQEQDDHLRMEQEEGQHQLEEEHCSRFTGEEERHRVEEEEHLEREWKQRKKEAERAQVVEEQRQQSVAALVAAAELAQRERLDKNRKLLEEEERYSAEEEPRRDGAAVPVAAATVVTSAASTVDDPREADNEPQVGIPIEDFERLNDTKDSKEQPDLSEPVAEKIPWSVNSEARAADDDGSVPRRDDLSTVSPVLSAAMVQDASSLIEEASFTSVEEAGVSDGGQAPTDATTEGVSTSAPPKDVTRPPFASHTNEPPESGEDDARTGTAALLLALEEEAKRLVPSSDDSDADRVQDDKSYIHKKEEEFPRTEPVLVAPVASASTAQAAKIPISARIDGKLARQRSTTHGVPVESSSLPIEGNEDQVQPDSVAEASGLHGSALIDDSDKADISLNITKDTSYNDSIDSVSVTGSGLSCEGDEIQMDAALPPRTDPIGVVAFTSVAQVADVENNAEGDLKRKDASPSANPRRRWAVIAALICVVILVLAVSLGVVLSGGDDDQDVVSTASQGNTQGDVSISPAPSAYPSDYPSSRPSDLPSDAPSSIPSSLPTTMEPLNFFAIADAPYNEVELQELTIQMDNISPDADFVVHMGDIWGNVTTCSLEEYEDVATLLSRSAAPVLVVVGDNEFNDCRDPETALQNWRQTFVSFEHRFWNATWPSSITMTRMPGRPETFSFPHKGIHFLGLNLVGGRVHNQTEWDERHSTQADWAMERIRDHSDLTTVIFAHVNPGTHGRRHDDFFLTIRDFLRDEVNDELPVWYINGDLHSWRFQPNFYNAPSWTRITLQGGTTQSPVHFFTEKDIMNENSYLNLQFDRQL